jgi:WD40 repeat protein
MSPSRIAATCLVALVADTIGADPPAPARVDLAGDPLPPGAIARLGTTRFRHHDWARRVFLLPAGDRVLSLGQDSKVTYWDVTTGRATDTFKDPDLFFSFNTALSSDGERLALFANHLSDKGAYVPTLRVYDLKARKTVWTTRPDDAERQYSYLAEFTPDGRYLITMAGEGDVRVWNAATGVEVRRRKMPAADYFFDLSPDGKTVATFKTDFFLWDWEAGGEPRKLAVGRNVDGWFRFSPDGKSLLLSKRGDSQPRMFAIATGLPTGYLDLGGRADWFSISPDGKTVAVGYIPPSAGVAEETGFVLRDVATGKEVRRLTTGRTRLSGTSQVMSFVQWSKDGSRVLSYSDHRVWVWDVKTAR